MFLLLLEISANINTFNVHINYLLRTFSNERKMCKIMGDFNIDLLTNDTNNFTTEFIHKIFANIFCPTISKPTRKTQQSATLIHNIIANIHEYPIKSGIQYNDISDHFPIFNFYNMGLKNDPKNKCVFKHAISVNNVANLNTKYKKMKTGKRYIMLQRILTSTKKTTLI